MTGRVARNLRCARIASLPRVVPGGKSLHAGAANLATSGILAVLIAAISLGAQASTITVDEAADDDPAVNNGNCSLREAVIAANSNTPVDACQAVESSVTDEIVFSAALDGEQIKLSIAGTDENNGLTGDLDILESVRIVGNGNINPGLFGDTATANTIINADGIDRVLQAITIGGTVTLEQLAITGGDGVAGGAGINSSGGTQLVLRDVLVADNTTSGSAVNAARGGGIASAGDLVMENSAVLNNGVLVSGTDLAEGGGVHISASATAAISQSVIADNTVQTELGTAGGAGLYLEQTGNLILTECLIYRNTATATSGDADVVANGAGLFLEINATADIDATMIGANASQAGSDATAREGGLAVVDAAATLDNVTVVENSVTASAGPAMAGAIGVRGSGDVILNNTTVVDNFATSGAAANGEGGGLHGVVGASLSLSNTMLVANQDSSGNSPDCAGPLVSNGYNILSDNSGCNFTAASGDQIGDVAGGGSAIATADVVDLSDGNNGGGFKVGVAHVPQLTVATVDGSLARDRGDPDPPDAGGSCETVDQRGLPRPADGDDDGTARCDVGAFEFVDFVFADRFES